jgi:endonuclease III
MKITEIPDVYRLLKREYSRHDAPVVEFQKTQSNDPFFILVATILSARTKDETTSAVCKRLFRLVRKPSDFLKYTQSQLEKLIFPIGFYRTKARHLLALPAALESEFGGRIPDEIDDLCRLPGVGRKTANLVRAVAFDKPAICVDVHVHRICNRLGLLKTKTPFETEFALRKILPEKYWITWNSILVSYGQTLCKPVNPFCNRCPVSRYCSRINVKTRHYTPGR